MIRRPPRSTLDRSSAASDVYKRQIDDQFTIQKPNTARFEDNENPKLISYITKSMVIFPNPSNGDVNVSLDNEAEMKVNISIFNSAGVSQFNKTITKLKDENIFIEKNESNLNPGIYFVNVSGDGFNRSEKLVVY